MAQTAIELLSGAAAANTANVAVGHKGIEERERLLGRLESGTPSGNFVSKGDSMFVPTIAALQACLSSDGNDMVQNRQTLDALRVASFEALLAVSSCSTLKSIS